MQFSDCERSKQSEFAYANSMQKNRSTSNTCSNALRVPDSQAFEHLFEQIYSKKSRLGTLAH